MSSFDAYLELLTAELRPTGPAPALSECGFDDEPGVGVRDRVRGSLLAGAIGDALGRPGEARPRSVVRDRYGRLDRYVPWRGWQSGPVGTWTDDTQLTIVVAEWLLATDGEADPADLAERLVAWLPGGRGVGSATRRAVENLTAGSRWYAAGEPSAGNGGTMRAAPVGHAYRHDPESLRTVAVLQASVTHRRATAMAAAAVHAHLVAWLTHRSGSCSAESVIAAAQRALSGLPDPPVGERHEKRAGSLVSLGARIAELPGLLHVDPDDAVDHLWNGAFVLETLPAALWVFLRYQGDPVEGLVVAASAGRDSDTMASMSGNLFGALCGTEWIPPEWLDELEGRDRLIALADGLLALSERALGQR